MFSVIEKGVVDTTSYSHVLHITTSLSCHRTHPRTKSLCWACKYILLFRQNLICVFRPTLTSPLADT